MTNGINGIGGNPYSWGSYASQPQGEDVSNNPNPQPPANNYEETQVDPSKIMDFMAANNIFVTPAETTKVGEVDVATQERVANYMENFEIYYGMIAEEFGEENAPMVMDFVMDKLIGMAA